MTNLYVLDFDKTLIPYDSWNLFLRKIFWTNPVKVGSFLLCRKMGLINRGEMKRRVSSFVTKSDKRVSFSRKFMKNISKDIQFPPCLFNGDNEKKVIVLTASPMCYMRHLNPLFDFEFDIVGSDYQNDIYIEMHGEQKYCYLHEHYPPTKYYYKYAVSDSDSDLVWMKEFECYEIKK